MSQIITSYKFFRSNTLRIKGLHHQVANIYGLQNFSLWEKTQFLSIFNLQPIVPFNVAVQTRVDTFF